MLTERNIAFFIDVYNTEMTAQHYSNIVAQLEQMGKIISGTIYGATERTHKDVLAQADVCGYTVLRASRKRGRKGFDNRIIVDIVDKVNHSKGIDTVAIVALPADMVYLYAYLRERGIKIISLNNGDEVSMALVDETVDSGKVETIQLPKAPAKPKAEPVAPVVAPVVEPDPIVVAEPVVEEPVVEPVVEEPVVVEPAPAPAEQTVTAGVSRMDQLLKEIDRLRAEVEKSAQPTEVPAPPVQEPVEEPAVEAPVEVVTEQPVAETPAEPAPVEAPAETPAEQPAQPKASYSPQDDADLLRKIEEMRKGAGTSEQLIDEIKKLLDDLD